MNHVNQREILGLGCRNTIIIEPVGIQVHPAELEFTHMSINKGRISNPGMRWEIEVL
jgi:NOL1/NOP2/fmu family ribosome biogenesis protein